MYAIIGGGGKVGFYLGRELISQGHEVVIIEQVIERADFIANELGNVVLKGNADEASTLSEAGAERADVVIAVTGDDEDNLVICQVAKRFGAARAIARINDPNNEGLFRLLGIDATINATEVLLGVLEQQIPHATLYPLLRLRNSDVEIVEATLVVGARAVGRAVRDLPLPPDCLIAVIIRGGTSIFPTGSTVLQVGDEVVAFTRAVHEPVLRSLFFPT